MKRKYRALLTGSLAAVMLSNTVLSTVWAGAGSQDWNPPASTAAKASPDSISDRENATDSDLPKNNPKEKPIRISTIGFLNAPEIRVNRVDDSEKLDAVSGTLSENKESFTDVISVDVRKGTIAKPEDGVIVTLEDDRITDTEHTALYRIKNEAELEESSNAKMAGEGTQPFEQINYAYNEVNHEIYFLTHDFGTFVFADAPDGLEIPPVRTTEDEKSAPETEDRPHGNVVYRGLTEDVIAPGQDFDVLGCVKAVSGEKPLAVSVDRILDKEGKPAVAWDGGSLLKNPEAGKEYTVVYRTGTKEPSDPETFAVQKIHVAEAATAPEITAKVIFSGVEDKAIPAEEAFDLLDGVRAEWKENEVAVRILSVVDKEGNPAELSEEGTVLENAEEGEEYTVTYATGTESAPSESSRAELQEEDKEEGIPLINDLLNVVSLGKFRRSTKLAALHDTGETPSATAERVLTVKSPLKANAKQAIRQFYAAFTNSEVKKIKDDYVWKPAYTDANEGHAFRYRIYYDLIGDYVADEISITIPRSLFRDRNGETADAYEMSVPEKDGGFTGSANADWYYEEDGDSLRIHNSRDFHNAQNGYIEVLYRTTKKVFDYADYGTESEDSAPRSFIAEIQAGNQEKRAEVSPVHIDTDAEIISTKKEWPTYYVSWVDSWGAKPEAADQYRYLVWEITSHITATQPYSYSLQDDFGEYGEVIGYRFGNSGQFTKENTIQVNPSSSAYDRHDYVLTRIAFAKYATKSDDDQELKIRHFAVSNKIQAEVTPVHGEKTSVSAEREYTYDAPHFIHPIGHFWRMKYGLDYQNRQAKDSTGLRLMNEDVVKFNLGQKDTLGDFAYYSYVEGDPYPWTLEDGADPDDPASYGKKKVTYELADDELKLGGSSWEDASAVDLTDDDYRFDGVDIVYSAYDTKYNENTCEFYRTSADLADDAVEIRLRLAGSGAYITAGYFYPRNGQFESAEGMNVFENRPNSFAPISGTHAIAFRNDAHVTGMKLVSSNAHYYTRITAYPHITLLNTETVKAYTKQYVSDTGNLIILRNLAVAKLYRGENTDLEPTFTLKKDGADYAGNQVRHSSLEKTLVSYQNNVYQKNVTVNWRVSMQEYLATTKQKIEQQSGTFYDLLPAGSTYQNYSAGVKDKDGYLSTGEYTVSVDDDYKGSGRTMLKVQVNKPADSYTLNYTTVTSWDSLKDLGTSQKNTLAYETGNGILGDGVRDDESGVSGITEKELMRDLDDNDGGAARFLYRETAISLSNVITASNVGLYKKVKADIDSDFTVSSVVYPGSRYQYKCRFATDSATKAKDLILFDSLENYQTKSGKTSDWHGNLTKVMTSYVEKMGIRPEVYYSTADPEAVEKAGYTSGSLDNPEIWSLEAPADLSEVHAIAIDLRKSEDGGDYVLPADSAVDVLVNMQAPDAIKSSAANPMAYNNIHLSLTRIDASDHTEAVQLEENYTQVAFHVSSDLVIHKINRETREPAPGISFELKGTSDYGTAVSQTRTTSSAGDLTFEKVEKGTYSLTETGGNPDYLSDNSAWTVLIDAKGALSIPGLQQNDDLSFTIENRPRVHGDLHFDKQDSVTKENISGAYFQLSGTSDYGNEVRKYATSSTDGVSFDDIERGKYTLTEIKAPDNHILPELQDRQWQVRCDGNGLARIENAGESADSEVIFNEPYHQLKIEKEDAETHEPLKGAEFHFQGTSRMGTAVEKTGITDDSGFFAFDHLEPGVYTLQETKAPENYIPDDAKHIILVNRDGITIDGNGVNEDGILPFYNQKVSSDTVVVKKIWDDGLTNSERTTYPNIHLVPEGSAEGGQTATIDSTEGKGSHASSTSREASETANARKSDGASGMIGKLRRAGTSVVDTARFLGSAVGDALAPLTALADAGVSYTFDPNTHTLTIGGSGVIEKGKLEQYKKYHGFKWKGITVYEGIEEYYWKGPYVVEDSSPMVTTIKIQPSADGTLRLEGDCSALFSNFKALQYLEGFDQLDTSRATNMARLFDGCESLKSINGLYRWDVSRVTNMSRMFHLCWELSDDALKNIANWNTGNVTDMSEMFSLKPDTYRTHVWFDDHDPDDNYTSDWDEDKEYPYAGIHGEGTSKLRTVGSLQNWNTANVKTFKHMFWRCDQLTDISGLGKWSTGNAQNLSGMFEDCKNLSNINGVSSWNTKSVSDMTGIFKNDISITSLNAAGNWDTSSVINASHMFEGCSGVKSFENTWKFGKVEDLSSMFTACKSLQSLECKGWDVSRTKTMASMFEGCKSLIQLKNDWNPENLTSVYSMFKDCSSLISVDTEWNLKNISSMGLAFSGCKKLYSLDLSLWDMKVTDSSDLFSFTDDCINLHRMKLGRQNKFWASGFTTWFNAELPNPDDPNPDAIYSGYWVQGSPYNHTNPIKFDHKFMQTYPNIPHIADPSGWWYWEEKGKGYYSDQGVHLDESRNTVRNVYDPHDGPVPEAYKQTGYWTKLSDTKWTYTFYVKHADEKTKWRIWEDAPDGYESDTGFDQAKTVDSWKDIVEITNKKTVSDKGFGSLCITKQVVDKEGKEISGGATQYAFTITLTDDEGKALEGTRLFGDIPFSDGVAAVSLRAGESLTVGGIPAGYHYTVEETTGKGYEQSWKEGNGSGVIGKDQTSSETCVNKEIQTGPVAPEKTNGFILGMASEDTEDEYTYFVELRGLDDEKEYHYTIREASDGKSLWAKAIARIFQGTAAAETTAFTSAQGEASLVVQLKNGEQAEFAGLPIESQYLVTADKEQHGTIAAYTVTDSSGMGQIASRKGENSEPDTALSTGRETVDEDESVLVKYTFTLQKFEVLVNKTDEGGMLIGGAELQIYSADGSSAVRDSWLTSAGLPHTELLPAGSYILRENVAPEGYEKAEDISFTVNKDGVVLSDGSSVPALTMVDLHRRLDVEICKVDNKDHNVAGAGLELYDEGGNLLDEWTTGEEAHTVKDLIYGGTFTLHEKTVPEGYEAAEDLVFKLTDDSTEICMVDLKQNPGEPTEPSAEEPAKPNGTSDHGSSRGGGRGGTRMVNRIPQEPVVVPPVENISNKDTESDMLTNHAGENSERAAARRMKVNTGDDSPMLIWITLMAGSGAVLAGYVLKKHGR